MFHKVLYFADPEIHYWHAIPYLIKVGEKPAINLETTVTEKLVESIYSTGQSIACDQHYTRLELFEYLLRKNFTTIETVIPYCKHLPVPLTSSTKRTVESTWFAFKDSCTICSWLSYFYYPYSIEHQAVKH